MRVVQYGIALERLGAAQLELVRRWRNREDVRSRMRYRERIGPQAQARWFRKLHQRNDWYFVAMRDASAFGLFHVKGVDWAAGSGEAGGFVGDPALVGGPEPALCILTLMDFAFFMLGLKSLEAQYGCGYGEIVALNRQLGYEVFAEEADGFVRARVSAERYLRMTGKLRDAAARLRGEGITLNGADPWLARHVEALKDGRAQRGVSEGVEV